jgi:hypothetical protein
MPPNVVPVNMTPLPKGNCVPSVTVILSVIESVAVAISVNPTDKVGPFLVNERVIDVGFGIVFTK